MAKLWAIMLAVGAVVALAAALTSAGSGHRAGAVKPVPGGHYPLNVVMQGVCQWTTRPDGVRQPDVGTYFQGLDQHGIWGNLNELPRQGKAEGDPTGCIEKIDHPGTFRMRVFKPDGDVTLYTVGPFYVGIAGPNPCTGAATKITSVETPRGGTSGLEGMIGKNLNQNQAVTVQADTYLDFADGVRYAITKGSTFRLDGCSPPQAQAPALPWRARFTLMLGTIWSKVTSNAPNVQVSTQRVVAGVRGTIFWISYQRSGQVTTVHVDQGTVWMRAAGKTITVKAGHTATQRGTKPPVVRSAPINTSPPFG